MKPLHRVISRPIVTEKSAIQKETGNVVSFQVGIDANKIEIKAAVEKAFDVKVKSVKTAIIAGKPKRSGRTMGKRSNYKKAFITLEAGSDIDLFGA